MIYKNIVEGKIFTTNVKQISGAHRVEVYTEKEYFELMEKNWFKKAMATIKTILNGKD